MSLHTFRQAVANSLSEEELITLCFDLGIDYDDLPARGKQNKIRELITLCRRTGRLPELTAALRQARPNVDWPAVAPPASQAASVPWPRQPAVAFLAIAVILLLVGLSGWGLQRLLNEPSPEPTWAAAVMTVEQAGRDTTVTPNLVPSATPSPTRQATATRATSTATVVSPATTTIQATAEPTPADRATAAPLPPTATAVPLIPGGVPAPLVVTRVAQITTLSGDTYIAAADFLRLGADAALPLESLGSIPFDEIASFTIALRGLNEPVTATIQLANGNTTSDIVPRDTLTGPSQVDRVAIPLQDVASVTFANSATPILVPLAMVTLRQGESVAVCATCLEMSFQTLEPYAGYRTHYERSLWLQNGLWVPVAGMRQLFFTDRYDVSILLHAGGEPISGRVRANTLRGATQGGFLDIGLNDVLQVDFQARPGFEAASSRVIGVNSGYV
jgi:hypothetical protein